MPGYLVRMIAAASLALALAGCKILPTPTEEDKAAAPAFNPDQMVADIWTAKVMPYLEAKAGPFGEVMAAAASDPAAAGERYGNPRKQANSPWTYAVRVDGKIVASNTKSRAATIDVDTDGDGKADARVQIGPAVRGTSLRDSLDFINFNDFVNQIDFAQFGKSFNTHADRTVLSALPREQLEGRSAKILGAVSLDKAAEIPLVTPAAIEIGPAP